MVFTKNKPAEAIGRNVFASAVESRDRDDDVIRVYEYGGRLECQRHALAHQKRGRCIASGEHNGAVADDIPVEGRISLRANVETDNNTRIIIVRIKLPNLDFGDIWKRAHYFPLIWSLVNWVGMISTSLPSLSFKSWKNIFELSLEATSFSTMLSRICFVPGLWVYSCGVTRETVLQPLTLLAAAVWIALHHSSATSRVAKMIR